MLFHIYDVKNTIADAYTLPWTFAANEGPEEQLNQLGNLSLNSSIKRAYSSALLCFLTFISMSVVVFQSVYENEK